MQKLAILTFVFLVACAPAFAAGCDSHAAASSGGDHKAGCPMGADGKSCPMKDKKVASSSDVEMAGKIVCMHCDLHKESSCRKAFQASKDQAVIEICPSSDMKAVEGEKGEILVSGKLVKAEDGSMVIEIKSAKKAS